jgi:formate hydrogenlyase subunit 6/NADH:ubiquinone oxidoreductase subunit I
MEADLYELLRKHLNTTSVGFPKSKSGVEMDILHQIYPPEDIPIMLALRDNDETIEPIYERYLTIISNPPFESSPRLTRFQMHDRLTQISHNGGIRMYQENGTWNYAMMPFLVGIYEFGIARMNPAWLQKIQQYASEKYAIEYLSTAIPQMRTIPIEQPVEDLQGIQSYDRLKELIRNSPGPFAAATCICRVQQDLQGKPCKGTDRREICMAMGPMAQQVIREGWGKEISREEAFSLQKQNQAEGFVIQTQNSQRPEFFCACCGCCCGILKMAKIFPRPVDFISNNTQAVLDPATCVGCGLCVKKCPMQALSLKKESQRVISINLKRCIGCGVCASLCSQQAIQLVKKTIEIIPPPDHWTLYEIIRGHRPKAVHKYYRLVKALIGKPLR